MRFWFCLCIASILLVGKVMAHPHVWVDSQYLIKVDQTRIHSLEATWSLDLFTSTSLIAEYDVNGDGKFTGQEKLDMIDIFQTFDSYGYFIKIKQDGEDLVHDSVQVLDVQIREQMIWVRFGVALTTPVNLETSTLSFAFGDDELYFAMEPLEEGLVRLSGAFAEICTPIEREAVEISVAFWVDLTCQS